MQEKIKYHSRCLDAALLCSLISSASLLLCIVAISSEASIFFIIIPCLFWGGLAGEQFFMWRGNAFLREIEKSGKRTVKQGRLGLISPPQSEKALIVDGIFVLSLITFIILYFGDWGRYTVQFVLLFLMVFTFRVHCIVNGKNYINKKYLSK